VRRPRRSKLGNFVERPFPVHQRARHGQITYTPTPAPPREPARSARPGTPTPCLYSQTHPEACMGRARRCARLAHLHALKDSCPRTVVKVARQLKPSRSTSSRRVHSAKLVISRGIWRTISENPCQKISKYSPNRTKHKHTKRAKSTATVQPQKVRPPQPIQWTSQTTWNRKALEVTDLSPPATPNVNVPPHHPPERQAWNRAPWHLRAGCRKPLRKASSLGHQDPSKKSAVSVGDAHDINSLKGRSEF
jgi:hypothetical protein